MTEPQNAPDSFKDAEERFLRRLDKMMESESFDQRWLAIGRTQLEQAFMAINRAVVRPKRRSLAGDNDD